MKKIIVLSVLLLAGCVQSGIYTPEEQTRVMSDDYLCENKDNAVFAEFSEAEIIKRGIDCKGRLKKKEKAAENSKKAGTDRASIREGSPLKFGMTQQEVMTALGMRGLPAKIHKNATSHGTFEHWDLCYDWLNKWNLSTINCNPSMDDIHRMMFVNGKLESFRTY